MDTAEERRAADAARKRLEYKAKKAAAQAQRPKLKDANTCAEWTRKNLRLVAQSSAVPGPFLPWRHQIAILNLPFLPSGPKTLTVQKCARAGFTKCVVAISAYSVLTGKNALLVQPRHKDALSFSVDALMPTLDECFGAEAHVGLPWTRTEMHLRPEAYSPAQSIKVLHGVSPDLRRVQASIACADELDAFDADIGGDGDLFQRLASRLRESKGRLIAGSTPTRRGSLLDQSMADADLVFTWSWKCPSCEAWQPFDFDKLEASGLACIECGEIHAERAIRAAPQRWEALDGRFIHDDGQTLSEGEWPHSVGFRINALSIPSLDWEDLRMAERRAKTPEARKVFYNEVIGKAWGASGRTISAGELLDQRQQLTGDSERCRVMAADVQRDRIETILTEWDEDERVYILDYEVLEGDTDQPGKGAWQLLGALATKWKPVGGMVDVGYRGDGAYRFCKRRGWRAIKGTQPLKSGGLFQVTRQRDRGADLVLADTSMAKIILYDRLSDERRRWFHFAQTLDEPFIQGILAEELRIVDGRNKWVRLGPNEALDCLVYAYVAQRFIRERLRWKKGREMPAIRKPRRFVARRAGLM